MEEDNIAVSLCILIIIASAILRTRLDRRPHRVWAQSWICKIFERQNLAPSCAMVSDWAQTYNG